MNNTFNYHFKISSLHRTSNITLHWILVLYHRKVLNLKCRLQVSLYCNFILAIILIIIAINILPNQSLFIGQCSRHIMLYPIRGMKLLGVNFQTLWIVQSLWHFALRFMNSGMESRFFFGEKNVRLSVFLKYSK